MENKSQEAKQAIKRQRERAQAGRDFYPTYTVQFLIHKKQFERGGSYESSALV